MATYGRQELHYHRQKYENLPNFDSKNVHMEWESFKPSMIDFMEDKLSTSSPATFWKSFINFKRTINERLCEQFKNMLILF